MAVCALCGKEIDPEEYGIYEEVAGWKRRRRGGGANAIRVEKETGRIAHSTCVDQTAHGVSPGQDALFGG